MGHQRLVQLLCSVGPVCPSGMPSCNHLKRFQNRCFRNNTDHRKESRELVFVVWMETQTDNHLDQFGVQQKTSSPYLVCYSDLFGWNPLAESESSGGFAKPSLRLLGPPGYLNPYGPIFSLILFGLHGKRVGGIDLGQRRNFDFPGDGSASEGPDGKQGTRPSVWLMFRAAMGGAFAKFVFSRSK